MNPRDRILTTADRLFYVQGVAGTGINQIIAEAGVAKATFYGHFRSKEALTLAYLKTRHESWFAGLRDEVASRRTARSQTAGAFAFLDKWLTDTDFRGCAFLNLLGEGPPPPELAAQVAQHKAELRQFFRAIAASSSPSSLRPTRLGDALLLLFEGALVEAQVHHALWPVRAASESAIALLATERN
ncbi:MAG: TetR/AcrR family transcriptional regulator [Myxococcota bacterium]